jgi:hypothetical protein
MRCEHCGAEHPDTLPPEEGEALEMVNVGRAAVDNSPLTVARWRCLPDTQKGGLAMIRHVKGPLLQKLSEQETRHQKEVAALRHAYASKPSTLSVPQRVRFVDVIRGVMAAVRGVYLVRDEAAAVQAVEKLIDILKG